LGQVLREAEGLLEIVASSALICASVGDVRSRRIPILAGYGMLVIGLVLLLLNALWLETVFYLAAIWGSRGGIWRLPILISALVLLAQGRLDTVPFVLGTLYVLTIFELGWFGGGDAQLALGLIAIGRDWIILGYLFGGTILLGLSMVFITRGLRGGAKRLWWVLRHMHAPDDQALRIPWGMMATLAGLFYIWVCPGLIIGDGL
jgi:hypothetical protein